MKTGKEIRDAWARGEDRASVWLDLEGRIDAALAEARAEGEARAKRATPDPERVAQMIAHRACCGSEHNTAQGKLHGYCVVCGVPWPCAYVGPEPAGDLDPELAAAREKVESAIKLWSKGAPQPGIVKALSEMRDLFRARAAPQEDGEAAWVIECRGGGFWACDGSATGRSWLYGTAEGAVRFARKEDAEAVMGHYQLKGSAVRRVFPREAGGA